MMWLLSTRIGRTIAAAVALVVSFLGYGALKQRKGDRQAMERVSHRASVAAEARKEKRDEIDDDADANTARDRLRKSWRD